MPRFSDSSFRTRPILFLLLWLPAQTGLKLRLVPETTAIVPGQSFRVGLFIQHEKGWHTYWRQPGIVGVPTTLEWQLPEGFKAGPLEYPEPEATKMFQIKAQGYERDVLLQTELQAPSNLKPGDTITLRGRAAWMCCASTCHPGTLELSLSLPVASVSSPDPAWQPRFAQERARYAQPSDAWSAEASEQGLNVTLTLRPTSEKADRGRPGRLPDPASGPCGGLPGEKNARQAPGGGAKARRVAQRWLPA